jgi:hypothetical protein
MKDSKFTAENIAIACLMSFGLLMAFALISGMLEVIF